MKNPLLALIVVLILTVIGGLANAQGVLYDDFSGTSLDTSKWLWNQFGATDLVDGRLYLNATSQSKSANSIKCLSSGSYAFLSMEGMFTSNTVVPIGTRARTVRIFGHYGHQDSNDLSNDTNAIEVQIFIMLDNRQGQNLLYAFVNAEKCLDESCSEVQEWYAERFATPVSPDTMYSMSLERNGCDFTFTFEDETVSFSAPESFDIQPDDYVTIGQRLYWDVNKPVVVESYIDNVYAGTPGSSTVCAKSETKPTRLLLFPIVAARRRSG